MLANPADASSDARRLIKTSRFFMRAGREMRELKAERRLFVLSLATCSLWWPMAILPKLRDPNIMPWPLEIVGVLPLHGPLILSNLMTEWLQRRRKRRIQTQPAEIQRDSPA